MIISIATQKGGCAKTTTAGILCHLLSKKYKVLAVDMDSQGSLTDMLTGRDISDYRGSTIYEALENQSPKGCVHSINTNIDIMTADDYLAKFPKWLYTTYRGNHSLALTRVLDQVKDNYDFVIIDTPPALGDHTINSLAVSDGVVVMFGIGRQSYLAIDNFLSTVGYIKEKVNPKIDVLGILVSMLEPRRSDHKALLEMARETYGKLVFNATIERRAATGRIDMTGFTHNTELTTAISQYKKFTRELLERANRLSR